MAIYHNNKKIVKIYHGNIPITRSYHGGILIYKEFNILDYNLLTNCDLLIDSNSDNVPDGFGYGQDITDKSLVNGILKFTATAQWAQFNSPSAQTNIGDMIYFYGRVKASSPLVRVFTVSPTVSVYHTGSGNWELLSGISVRQNTSLIVYVSDNSSSLWTPIEVDYMGAINITDLVSRGILPSGLTNEQYKTLLDSLIQ